MPLLDDCQSHFNTQCLYGVMGVDKTAKQPAVKKAYYKQSMRWHPDRFATASEEEKQTATRRFQIISSVYGVLSDAEKRALYDESGVVDDEGVLSSSDGDAYAMWRSVFKKVTVDDIEKYLQKYRGSTEEKDDIVEQYTRWEGDVDKMMETVIGADDEERMKGLIEELIEEGRIKKTKKFSSSTGAKKTASRKRKAAAEAAEAEEALKDIKKRAGRQFSGAASQLLANAFNQYEGDGDLAALILGRQAARGQQMNNLFDSLADKYGGGGAKKGGAKRAKKTAK